MRTAQIFIPAFLLLASVAASAAPLELHSEFKVPAQGVLRESVDFWLKIYSELPITQGVLHDAKNPRIIYETLDFKRRGVHKGTAIRLAKERLRKILLHLHEIGIERDPAQRSRLSEAERRVYDLFRDVNEPNRFLNAAHYKRLRFQLGQREQFMNGVRESGRYLPFMEAIFIRKGLPYEMTRLPFVESSFNTRARSKVGASGIWQFMRSTGKNFLVINDAIDERNDPLRATEAAAELLKVNYDSLGSWPLAVTAYNHGRIGIMKAVRKTGTNSLEDILVNYKSRTFGFASANFFACLLASIEIERNFDHYFGKIDRERPVLFYEVKLPDSIRLRDLVTFLRLKRSELLDLNPALTEAARLSAVSIPAGYSLRLANPGTGTTADNESRRRVFLAGFAKIPRVYRGRGHP